MNTNPLKTASHRNLVSLNGIRSSIAIVFSSFVFAPIASAADYYVATTGSNSYTATQAQNSATPWKTIQKAADTVPAGSKVHVAPGNYTGTLTIAKGGTSEATRVYFVSDTKWGAKILGDPANASGAVVIMAPYVSLEGFDISTASKPATYYNGVTITGTGGVGGSYVIVKGNYIHNINTSDDHGLGVSDEYYYLASDGNAKSRYNQVIGNFITKTDGYAVYISTYQATVANNVIVDVGRFGIHLWHAANQATVVNNTIVNVHRGVPTDSEHQDSAGIIVGAGDEPGGVTNNSTKVHNNIIMGTLNGGVTEYGATGSGNSYQNNLFYNAGSYNYALKNKLAGSGTVNANPLLVQYVANGTGNYHLAAGSTAINAGAPQGAPTTDCDGVARTGNPDIGAYEYVGSFVGNPPLNLRVVLQ